MTTSTKIGCAHCPQEFDTDQELVAHSVQAHWDKLKRTKLPTTAKQAVLVNMIVDKSGSMSSKINDTIGGFNTYLAELKKAEGVDYSFSLTLFDTSIHNRHVAVKLDAVANLDPGNYAPGGGTALNDAVGITVRKVEADKPKVDKVITVIMTDGEENSSREFTTEAIKQLIAEQEKKGNWTFIFLGASPNAWMQGAAYGIAATNSAHVDQNKYVGTYAAVAHAVNSASADCAVSQDFNLLARAPVQMRKSANLQRAEDDWDHKGEGNPTSTSSFKP